MRWACEKTRTIYPSQENKPTHTKKKLKKENKKNDFVSSVTCKRGTIFSLDSF